MISLYFLLCSLIVPLIGVSGLLLVYDFSAGRPGSPVSPPPATMVIDIKLSRALVRLLVVSRVTSGMTECVAFSGWGVEIPHSVYTIA